MVGAGSSELNDIDDFNIESLEPYSDSDLIFWAVHRDKWKTWQDINDLQPAAFNFRDNEDGMSCDWNKYSTPEETLSRRKNSTSAIKGIAQIDIKPIRIIGKETHPRLRMKYDPKSENKAHSLLINFPKKRISRALYTKLRAKLAISENFKWALKPID